MNVTSKTKLALDSPMTGCAIKPEIGPASHTRLVTCSETPRESKKGVPYLAWLMSEGFPRFRQRLVYPSSTVQAIWAPAIDILMLNRSRVESRRRLPFISALETVDPRRDELTGGVVAPGASSSRSDLLRAPGQGI